MIPEVVRVYARMLATLERYGHHGAGCGVWADGSWMHAVSDACTCGLSRVIREARP